MDISVVQRSGGDSETHRKRALSACTESSGKHGILAQPPFGLQASSASAIQSCCAGQILDISASFRTVRQLRNVLGIPSTLSK